MIFWVVICAVIVIAVLSSMSQTKAAEEQREKDQQKAKADVAATFKYTCDVLEALDILENELSNSYYTNLAFYRNIGISQQTYDSVFEVKYLIIKSRRSPHVQEALDSVRRELNMRNATKNSGESLQESSSPDSYTVWRNLTYEQLDTLDDLITNFEQRRDEDNDIELKGTLLLRFDTPSNYDSYTRKANIYVRALAEAIHEKFPSYGFDADTYGIHFNDKNGAVSYNGI